MSTVLPESLKVSCPGCAATLRMKSAPAPGKQIRCPKCGEAFAPVAPRPKAPAAPAPADEDDWLNSDLSGLEDTTSLPPRTAVAPPPRVGGKPKRAASTTSSESRPRRERASAGDLLGSLGFLAWPIGGAVGGLAGAAIWAAIAYATEHEIGWIAWGVGLLVGLGVRFAAGESDGFGPGLTAVGMSFVSIWAGKAGAIFFLVRAAAAQGEIAGVPADPIALALASLVAVPLTFGPLDLLWFGLAGFTAFKVGSNMASDSEG